MGMKKWTVGKYDRDNVVSLSEECGLPVMAALVLCSRGINTKEAVDSFFNGSEKLADPYTFADMDKAVDRIEQAIDNGEKIAVYGDYDVDGITSTTLVCSYLDIRGADAIFYIPDREKEGYGLNINAIDKLKEKGVSLIVTVDNGIAAVEESKYAASVGIDMVITDHHMPGEVIPEAIAVVDPHRSDCPSKFKDYAGVGVAFKLICALEGADSENEMLEEFSDIVALGTIADIVPLEKENRTLCKLGIKCINNFSRPGIESLKLISGLAEREIDSLDIAYYLAPRINAAGRIGNASVAVKLLMSDDVDKTDEYVEYIQKANRIRREKENEITELALKQITENKRMRYYPVLVVYGENWHHGVIGIIAARLCQKFGKPCFVFSTDGEVAKGSGRSVEGFDLYEVLSEKRDLYLQFGGHKMAAGVTVAQERLDDFISFINKKAAGMHIPPVSLKIDAWIKAQRLSLDTVSALDLLKPFGCSNEKPVFGVSGVHIKEIIPVSEGKHVKLTLSNGNFTFNAIMFGTGYSSFEYNTGDTIDVAVQIDKNLYGERTYLSVVVRDIRISGRDYDSIFSGSKLYDRLRRGDKLTSKEYGKMAPTRIQCAEVYKLLRELDGREISYEMLCYRINSSDIDYCKMRVILDIFNELDIINSHDKIHKVEIKIARRKAKANLNESKILSKLIEKAMESR